MSDPCGEPRWFVRQLIVYGDDDKEVDQDVSYGFAYIDLEEGQEGPRLARHVFIFQELSKEEDPKFWSRLPSVIDYLLSSFVLELGDDETKPKDDVYFLMSTKTRESLAKTDVSLSEIIAREKVDVDTDAPAIYIDRIVSRPMTWDRVNELKVKSLLSLNV